jgi:hypothetical protein
VLFHRLLRHITIYRITYNLRSEPLQKTDVPLPDDLLHTPVTCESLIDLRAKIEQGTALDPPSKRRFQKLANATEKAFADRAILLDENKLLFDQNNEKTTRLSVKSTVTATRKS